jgi:hypothetical protein
MGGPFTAESFGASVAQGNAVVGGQLEFTAILGSVRIDRLISAAINSSAQRRG